MSNFKIIALKVFNTHFCTTINFLHLTGYDLKAVRNKIMAFYGNERTKIDFVCFGEWGLKQTGKSASYPPFWLQARLDIETFVTSAV